MLEVITLAGGCVWGVQHYFDNVMHVTETTAGLSQVNTQKITNNCIHNTTTPSPHVEACRIMFNSDMLSLEELLLNHFFQMINPTLVYDIHDHKALQYKSGIFYSISQQVPIIQSCIATIQVSYQATITVSVEALRNFFPLMNDQQHYLQKNPATCDRYTVSNHDDKKVAWCIPKDILV